jgi:large subunit ribosomal protein L25
MAEYTLIAEGGRTTGSRSAGRLRSTGRVPAVVYGHGTAPLSVSVDGRELRHALSSDAGLNQLLNLEVDGERHLTLARELQRHPVRNTVVHVDFQIVSRDEVISAEVPVILVGEAKEVEVAKGLIEQPLLSLTVNATPGAIPSSIEVDVTELTIGDMIRVGDLALPAGVTTDIDPDETVVIAAASSTEADVATDDAAAEGGAGSADTSAGDDASADAGGNA